MCIMKIGICKNERIWKHSGDWSDVFIQYCELNNVDYSIIDPYNSDVIKKIEQYDILLWSIQNYLYADLLEARNILRVAERMRIKVFPNQNTIWHFDDKVAEMYAFQSINAPMPDSWVYYSLEDTIQYLKKKASFPLVAKLRCGSGASNVKLLKSESDAISYAKRMFSKGYDPSPSLLYKAYSKAQSSKDWKMVLSRIKKIPMFLYTRSHAKQMPIEKGYCYFQRFVKNAGFDIKVVVVGDKLSFLVRKNRKGDFRASGGGEILYDRSYISEQIIDSAFKIADELGLQCVGFDYVVEENTGKGFVIEMCYGFDYESIIAAGGYFDRNKNWVDEPLNVPYEVMRNILK